MEEMKFLKYNNQPIVVIHENQLVYHPDKIVMYEANNKEEGFQTSELLSVEVENITKDGQKLMILKVLKK